METLYLKPNSNHGTLGDTRNHPCITSSDQPHLHWEEMEPKFEKLHKTERIDQDLIQIHKIINKQC